jgi:tRNA(fMet)-specific endonuclease VapC
MTADLPPSLLDTSTLSDVMRAQDTAVGRAARAYLAAHGGFTFSILTRYEILRGLLARGAVRQTQLFDAQCRQSHILPLTDAIIARAAAVYAELYRHGQLISDADILIAATALTHGLPLVTENPSHFRRIPDLPVESWRTRE